MITTKHVFNVGRKYFEVDFDKVGNRLLVVESNKAYLRIRKKKIIYGDGTGFGERVRYRVPASKGKEKQTNLIYSLNCGSGEDLREDHVRAAMFDRIHTLAQGYSCVSIEMLEEFCKMLNENKIPKTPWRGSIGNSGDLIPSSYYAMELLNRVGLEGRDGLALANGTQFMTGIAALALEDFEYLYNLSCGLIGLLFQCLTGIEGVLDDDLHNMKAHREEKFVARRFRSLLKGSKALRNIDEITALNAIELSTIEPIQDRYSLRCMPHQLGSIMRMFRDAQRDVNNELNSISDNPIMINGKIKHGGHFDGSYVADAMDHKLKPAIRRLAHVLRAYMRNITDSKLNYGLLPTYLVANDNGLHNGLQGLAGLGFDADFYHLLHETEPITQYAQNDGEGTNQDIISLGMHASYLASRSIDILICLVAKLSIITRQAVALRKIEKKLSIKTRSIYQKLTEHIRFVDQDRSLHHDLRKLEKLFFEHKF